MTETETPEPPQPARDNAPRVLDSWSPLAASWLLMGLELPAVSAMMARMPDPTISLAAYGGVVFPVALLIESPIIMFLTASTALSKDRASYRLGRDFMLGLASALTLIHAAVAFTPLYDVVARGILGVPEEIHEPGRRGLQIFTPFTFAVAYRRFQQGVLIRFGRSRLVGFGTAVRLATIGAVLGIGWSIGTIPGIVVGSLAVSLGVISEAVFAAWAVRPAVRELPESTGGERLGLGAYLRFYLPLAMTTMLMFVGVPLTSAAVSRMPNPIASLAVWPVLNGIVFTLRSVSFALNEVVIALLERPNALTALRRFARVLAMTTSAVVLVAAATPLGATWFARVAALPPDLATIATIGLWLAVLLPGITAYQSFYQGILVHGRRTRAITESMAVFLVVIGVLLSAGIAWGRHTGLFVGMVSWVLGTAAQVAWLRFRARGVLSSIAAREAHAAP